MSARPRTEASWRIEASGAPMVRFCLDRSGRRRAIGLDPAELDATWRLDGAALVANFRRDVHGAAVVARDLLLVCNVLGRVRANLLLASAPVVLEHGFLERDLVCDDERVARLAGVIR